MTEREKLNDIIDALTGDKKALENRVARMAETIRRAELAIDSLVHENCNLRESLRSGDGLINDPIVNINAQFKTIRETTNE
jgi:hypothetical protein